jgi:hypothetical protein
MPISLQAQVSSYIYLKSHRDNREGYIVDRLIKKTEYLSLKNIDNVQFKILSVSTFFHV